MAVRLTAILLLVMFAVLQFGGRNIDGGPFVEAPGASPQATVVPVPPLEGPLPPAASDTAAPPFPVPAAVDRTEVPAPPAPEVAAAPPAAPVPGDEAAADPAGALDLVVIDPTAGLTPAAPAPTPQPPAPEVSALDTLQPPAQGTAPEPPEGVLAEVTGTGVNLRAGPSTTQAVLGRAGLGDRVAWLDDPAPGWAMIAHPDLDGPVYMSNQYLRRIDE